MTVVVDGEGEAKAPGQAQSVSLVQLGLTHRLSPPTVIHLRLVLHSVSLSQVSKQAVGSGEDDGDGDGEGLGLTEGDGDGLGDGEAATVKLNSQTFSGTTCCTGGSWGEAVGLGLGLGKGTAGFFNCRNKITAVTSRMTVKPINPHNNHLLSFFILICLPPGGTACCRLVGANFTLHDPVA